MPQILREYIVTLKSRDDLETFYFEMENQGSGGYVPERAVECVNKRPLSRNTHYLLHTSEVDKLRQDPRVQAVTMLPKDLGIKARLHGQTATWSRGNNIVVDQKNWGLYRSTLENNVSGWGSESGNTSQTATVNITGSGKNVDVVVVDEFVYPNHSEYNGRLIQFDWFDAYNDTVWPDNPNPTYQYSNYSGNNNHATAVTAVIAGNTQGWARDAYIYNIGHSQTGFNANNGGSGSDYVPSYLIYDYIRAFHNAKVVNPDTGIRNPTVVNNSWGLGSKVNVINTLNGLSNSRFSKINFRGSDVTASSLGNPLVDTGVSGAYTAISGGTDLVNKANGGNRITTTSSSAGSVSIGSISKNIQGRTGLSNLGLPTASSPNGYDEYDDAYWEIALPFQIQYFGQTYGPSTAVPNIYVNTNSYVLFGSGIGQYAWEVSATFPTVRKILISSGDRSCQSLWTGISGTSPNRTFRIRWEGHDAPTGGVLNSPTFVWEMTFYEATADRNRIDLHIDQNSAYRGEFSLSQLEQFGIMQSGELAPYRDAAIDADIEDAIADGIIFVGSSGNGGFKVDIPGGQDYDNYYVDNGVPYYYHRGSSPGNSRGTGDADLNIISVGAVDSTSQENKMQYSNTGPGVDIYAPGNNVITAVYDGTGVTGVSWEGNVNVNDGSPILTTLSSVARSGNIATITTSAPHGLSSGNVVSVVCATQTTFDTFVTEISVTGLNTFTYSNTGSDVSTTSDTGTITVGYLYKKYGGTSMATAQVTGLLAIVLETYPNMKQADAKEYLLNYAKLDKMFATTGGFTDSNSLQDGNNRFLFYYKERQDSGNVFPKINYQIRPTSGQVFPRTKIRRR